MTPNRILALAALSGALAVLLGAFGAHALRAELDADRLTWFETGVRYHAWHALALGLCGAAGLARPQTRTGALRLAAWAFALGILLFSGSLYLLAITDTRWLGAVTPLGGTAFVAGWLLLGWWALRRAERPT